MKTIYIDHNVAHYFVIGFPAGWNSHREKEALAQVHASKGAVRISFSAWNIVESAREYPKNAEALGQFLDAQSPIWMHDRRVIQRAEVRNFVYAEILGKANKTHDVPIFAENLSQVFHDLMPREIAKIGETAISICKELARNPKASATLSETEQAVPDALRTLAKAKSEGKLSKEIREQTNREWLAISIPERDPDDRPFKPEERQEVLNRAVAQLDGLLLKCPAMRAEELMEGYRTDDAIRNPKRSDAVDLQHAVPALAYCDAIITNDGYLNGQCHRYVKEAGRDIIVARSLVETVERLGL